MMKTRSFSEKKTIGFDSFDVTKCLQQIEKPVLFHVCATILYKNHGPSCSMISLESPINFTTLLTLVYPSYSCLFINADDYIQTSSQQLIQTYLRETSRNAGSMKGNEKIISFEKVINEFKLIFEKC